MDKKHPHKCHKSIFINKDFSIHRILLDRDKFIWLGSVYLSLGSPTQIQLLFKKIYENIPQNEWKFIILAGDFNVNLLNSSKKRELLICLCKQFKLELARTYKNTHLKSELDYVIHGNGVIFDDFEIKKSPSDHNLILWDIQIPIPKLKPYLKLPNRKLANHVTIKALLQSKNATQFLTHIGESTN